MTEIHISGIKDTGVTMVSNSFIGHFMTDANGDYVKVYLYLLYVSGGNGTFSMNGASDFLGTSEKALGKALEYWEKTGLIKLFRNSAGEIENLELINADAAVENTGSVVAQYAMKPDEALVSPEVMAALNTDNVPALNSTYHIVEKYLGRLLNARDITLINNLYEKREFSAELIIYLYEYCTNGGHREPSYIEKVASNWVDEGVKTIEDARTASVKYNKTYKLVMKTFGENRLPAEIEREYIDKWSNIFHMSDEVIKEACNRTIINSHRPDFKYADGIISSWASKKINTLDGVKAEDKLHAASVGAFKTASARPGNNRFVNSYDQRNYTDSDFEDIEEKLLNKNNG
jgi:DnaD/phage-associated family protein